MNVYVLTYAVTADDPIRDRVEGAFYSADHAQRQIVADVLNGVGPTGADITAYPVLGDPDETPTDDRLRMELAEAVGGAPTASWDALLAVARLARSMAEQADEGQALRTQMAAALGVSSDGDWSQLRAAARAIRDNADAAAKYPVDEVQAMSRKLREEMAEAQGVSPDTSWEALRSAALSVRQARADMRMEVAEAAGVGLTAPWGTVLQYVAQHAAQARDGARPTYSRSAGLLTDAARALHEITRRGSAAAWDDLTPAEQDDRRDTAWAVVRAYHGVTD